MNTPSKKQGPFLGIPGLKRPSEIEHDAKARLIAAALKMLEALQEVAIRATAQSNYDDDELRTLLEVIADKARVAIKQATGA